MKGLLEFDGALAPILAIMVQNDAESNRMLDDSSAANKILDDLSNKLKDLMHYNDDNVLENFISKFGEPAEIVGKTLKDINNPYREMQEIAKLID